MTTFIHPTAVVEDSVKIGADTALWDHVHVRGPTHIGEGCVVGGKSYIAYGVEIGNRVKINSFVYICTAVSVEDGAMISAGTIFTNDRYPRAATPDLTRILASAPNENTLPTRVREGATIGARSVIGCGLDIGRFALVGMGTVVTSSVPDFHLVFGNPARSVGFVCRCGPPFAKFEPAKPPASITYSCPECTYAYRATNGIVEELGLDTQLSGD